MNEKDGADVPTVAPTSGTRSSMSLTRLLSYECSPTFGSIFPSGSGALAKYGESAFTNLDLPSWTCGGRFEQVASHEAIHVSTLIASIGKDAVRL